MTNRRATPRITLLIFAAACVGYASEIDVQGLASSVATAIAKSGKNTVAVVDFVDLRGNPTEFGRFLAEEISVALVASGSPIEVVDRAHVKAILAEHKLAEKGLIDVATARQAAQLVGADLLLTGTVTPFSGTVRVSAKVMSAQTGRIVAAASIDLPRTRAVDDILASAIDGGETLGTQGPAPSATTLTRVPPSEQAPNAATAKQLPATQYDSLKITLGEVGVTPEAYRAALSVVIENTSKETVYLALQNDSDAMLINHVASLSDDKGNAWQFDSLSGLERLPNRSDPKYNEVVRASENYTAIPPSGRTALVMHFHNAGSNGDRALVGSLFSFSAQGARYSASGVTRFSIGLTGIKGAVVKQ